MAKKEQKKLSFVAWGRELVSGILALGAPGALDVLHQTRHFVLSMVDAFTADVAAGRREYPDASEHTALVAQVVDALTQDERRKKDIRQMVVGGRYWGLNLINSSNARREQAELSRAKQSAKKESRRVKGDAAEGDAAESGGKDRDSQMIALAVTNARRRGVTVDAIVAALDSL